MDSSLLKTKNMKFGDTLEDVEVIYNYIENQKNNNSYSDINNADIDPLVRLSDALIYLNNNGFKIDIGEKSHTLFVTKDKYLIPICNVPVIKEI